MAGLVALAGALLLACQLVHSTPVPVLKHAPASTLTLKIEFDETAPFDGVHFAYTQVGVTVFVSSGGHAVGLSSKQKLMCNGVQFYNLPNPELFAWIDRQPATAFQRVTVSSASSTVEAIRWTAP
jgi:hypothetical protein